MWKNIINFIMPLVLGIWISIEISNFSKLSSLTNILSEKGSHISQKFMTFIKSFFKSNLIYKKVFLLQVGFSIYIIFRILFSNIYGLLLLTLSIYFLLPHFTPIKPFNFVEFIIWFDSLGGEYKISLLSSLLTIVGFLIAFQTATTNWTQQMQTEIRIDAAKDLELSYNKALELILSIETFIRMNIDIINKIEEKKPTLEIRSNLMFLSSESPKFYSNRQELSNLHIRLYQLYGKHSLPLLATWNSLNQLEQINESLSVVTQKIWQVFIPEINISRPDYEKEFANYSDKNILVESSELCNLSRIFISGTIGGIKGKLMNSLMEKNTSTLVSLWQQGRNLKVFYSIQEKIPK
jgi:hypothetical protein